MFLIHRKSQLQEAVCNMESNEWNWFWWQRFFQQWWTSGSKNSHQTLLSYFLPDEIKKQSLGNLAGDFFFYKLILNYIKHINDITKLGTAICGIQKFSKVRGEYKKRTECNYSTCKCNSCFACGSNLLLYLPRWRWSCAEVREVF